MAHIKTYCRIKPSAKNYEDYDTTSSTLYVRVPDHYNPVSWGVHVRPKSVVNHEFKFNGVFRPDASQEEVFTTAASGIVDGFLTGYNGTIFAYGQTGTGKTYTVEGAARMYKDRGLAPRALSMIYKALASRQADDIEVHVSYMEIYQEIGYDLLNTAARTNSVVTPFPKVAVVEGSKGSCIIRNLSTHLAANEDVAQSLLLQGQANRKIAETPMNQRSSRSHAVFSIYLNVKEQNSDIVTKSKLHLVDLAGSERVSKTGTIGLQLSEAKHINLSLHHLEGVIVALQREVNGGQNRATRRPATASSPLDFKLYNRWVESQKSSYTGVNNKFIPYRNSLLTMVLRDSLGGNCQTSMIAAISLEPTNLSESISTCRFSQRVACVTNTLRKNEEIDDRSMIKRLRKKIAELESEISFLRSDTGDVSGLAADSALSSKLTDEDKLQCAGVVERYVRGRLKDPIGAGVNSVVKFRECLRLFKSLVLSHLDLDSVRSLSMVAPADMLSKSCENLTEPKSAWEEERSVELLPSQSVNAMSTGDSSQHNGQGRKQPLKQPSQLMLNHTFSHSSSQPHKATANNPFISDKPYKPKTSNGGNVVVNNPATDDGRAWPGTGGHTGDRVAWGGHSGDSRPESSSSSGGRGQQIGNAAPTRSSSAPAGRAQHASAKPAPYKSPFERKKEQEILKLDKKVEKATASISSQKQNLREMQAGLREQQLRLLRQEVSTKVERTLENMADQHAYILRLKKSGADGELVQQEELVKQQLIKRQHKMERRLGAIDQELCHLKDREENRQPKGKANSSGEKPKASGVKVEQRFSEFVKRDGKVDSRKVMQMLQSRDRKQEKLHDKLELEKQMALSTQVELKETATRQKLQEFREKLKQSRNLSSGSSLFSFDNNTNDQQHGAVSTCEDVSPHTSPIKTKSEVLRGEQNGTVVTSQTGETTWPQPDSKSLESVSLSSDVFTDSMVSFSSHDYNRVYDATTNNQDKQNDKNSDQSGDVPASRSTSSSSVLNRWSANTSLKSSLSDLEKLRATSTPQGRVEPTKQWDSAYSFKSTHPGFDVGPANHLDSIHSQGIRFSPLMDQGYEDISFLQNSEHPRSESGHEDSDIEDISLLSSSKKSSATNHAVGNNSFGQGYVSKSLTSDIVKDPFSAGYFTRPAQSHTRSASDYETESNASTVTLKDHGSSNTTSHSVSGSEHCQKKESPLNDRTSIMGSVENITDYEKSKILGQSHGQGNNTGSGRRQNEPFKKESRNGLNETKSGLEHRNFDEALSKMLGVSPAPAFNKQQYDVYARQDQTRNTPQTQSHARRKQAGKAWNVEQNSVKNSQQHKSRVKEVDNSSLRSSATWGPEARNLSISDRLSSYLDNSTVNEQQQPGHKSRSFEDSDIAPYRKPRVADDEQAGEPSPWRKQQTVGKLKPDIDLDRFKVPIKAMKDEEREQTYLNSAQAQKDRIKRIRLARNAAEVIQRYWRKHQSRK